MAMQKATIKAIELVKSKKGALGVRVCVVTDDKQWVRDWIGETAPMSAVECWWIAGGCTPLAWSDFASPKAWELVETEVMVQLEDSDYGMKIKEVRALDSGVSEPMPAAKSPEPSEDEIPF
tara:strand:- start:237 stop:599 length:363 start_codon:yes stop_codon:yes gene_type:complete